MNDLSTAPTASPTNLNTLVLSANIISVTWDPPAPIDQNGVITHYLLTFRGIERDTATRDIFLFSNQSFFTDYFLADLESSTIYDIEVSASTEQGFGPIARISSRTEPESKSIYLIPDHKYIIHVLLLIHLVPFIVPNNLRTTVLASTSIRVTWEAPDIRNLNNTLNFYSLTYYGVELDKVVRVVNYTISGSNHTTEAFVFSGLQEYTEYVFLVAAHSALGRGQAGTVRGRTYESGNNLLLSF